MTVLDSSAIVDFLLGIGVAERVRAALSDEGEVAAPDLLVFEVLAVLRRHTLRGECSGQRAAGAVADLADLPLALFASLPLRDRAWALRDNLTVADGCSSHSPSISVSRSRRRTPRWRGQPARIPR